MNTLYSNLIAWVKSGINWITTIKDANVWGIHLDLLEDFACVRASQKEVFLFLGRIFPHILSILWPHMSSPSIT